MMNMPFTCKLAGNQFRPISAQVVKARLADRAELTLVAEPDNAYDADAIKVFEPGGEHIGYIPRNSTAYIHHNGLASAKACWSAQFQSIEIAWPTAEMNGSLAL